jgi:hypothetical protein
LSLLLDIFSHHQEEIKIGVMSFDTSVVNRNNRKSETQDGTLWFTGNTEDVDENVPDMRTNTN